MPQPAVGVVLVHGIGRQAPREFLHDVISQIGRFLDRAGRDAVRVRFYEVYWADLGPTWSRREAFRYNVWLLTTVWRPALLRLRRDPGRPDLTVPLVQAGVLLVGFVHISVSLAIELACRMAPRLPALSECRRSLFEYAGDVSIYANRRRYRGRTRRDLILARFDRVLRRAAAECDRVLVLGHSLGSVIAHDGLSRETGIERPVDTLLTVGSPLDKFRFLWPPESTERPAPRTCSGWRTWINVTDVVDPIGARLHRFPDQKGAPAPTNRVISHRVLPTRAHADYWAHDGLMTWLADLVVTGGSTASLPGSDSAIPGAAALRRVGLSGALGVAALAGLALAFAAGVDFALGVTHDVYASSTSPTVRSRLGWLDALIVWMRDWLGFHEGVGHAARGFGRLLTAFALVSLGVAAVDLAASRDPKPPVPSSP